MSFAEESILSDADCEAYFSEVLKEAERGEKLWNDCTVHHMLNKSGKGYTNFLVQTSKEHTIHKVNISTQFWILNELMYPLEILFSESNFTYDPISLPSVYDDPSFSVGHRLMNVNLQGPSALDLTSSNQVSLGPEYRSLGELIPMPNSKLPELLSSLSFHGHSKKERNLLLSKHTSIQTFTGIPFDNNKSKFGLNVRDTVFDEGFRGKAPTRLFSNGWQGWQVPAHILLREPQGRQVPIH